MTVDNQGCKFVKSWSLSEKFYIGGGLMRANGVSPLGIPPIRIKLKTQIKHIKFLIFAHFDNKWKINKDEQQRK